MGWAARENTRLNPQARMRRLRELCRQLPRDVVLGTLDQMSEADQALVRKILDDEQPPPAPELSCAIH